MLLNSLYEARVTLILKPEKHITENDRPISRKYRCKNSQ